MVGVYHGYFSYIIVIVYLVRIQSVGNEWVKCDDVMLAKDFFPRMYKWYLRSQNFSLDPGFTDNLTAQLSIRFPGALSALKINYDITLMQKQIG